MKLLLLMLMLPICSGENVHTKRIEHARNASKIAIKERLEITDILMADLKKCDLDESCPADLVNQSELLMSDQRVLAHALRMFHKDERNEGGS